MSISVYNMKKWIKMLSGNSILHVNQGVGRIYSLTEIKGYYNDLTEKVTRDKEIDQIKIPSFKTEDGQEIMFPITIFQYGLAAYDLYLIEKKDLFLNKFRLCVDWALQNQKDNGSWNSFFFKYPQDPYSAMAQGEGVSLLIRAYKIFDDEQYLTAAKRAVNFMIKPVEEGGTAKYSDREVYFQEITTQPTVLNGWIFALFGLYDYLKVVEDESIGDIFKRSIQTMTCHLEDFDNGYWSKYNIEGMLSSPFYHKLHIAQLDVMYQITNIMIFKEYEQKWRVYSQKTINRYKAFILKAFQKVLEKN